MKKKQSLETDLHTLIHLIYYEMAPKTIRERKCTDAIVQKQLH